MERSTINCTTDTLEIAIHDLSEKIGDLTCGTSDAEEHFDDLIGDEAVPGLNAADRAALLSKVREELQTVLDQCDSGQTSPLSPEAVWVLKTYAQKAQFERNDDLPMTIFGKGVPCHGVEQSVKLAKRDLFHLLQAVVNNEEIPARCFPEYFSHFEDDVEPAPLIEAALAEISRLEQNLEAAWKHGLDIPRVIYDSILKHYLAATSSITIH
jgi:hypothetical protein